MPRIRCTKPEFYDSETLAMVTLSAERTFGGLWPFSDDFGRIRDHPKYIRAKIWCMRVDEHSEEDVADDLRQLAAVGVICRYVGCDGKTYLHTVNWKEHQRIDKPGAPHWPSCPVHQPTQPCSKCKGPCTGDSGSAPTPPEALPKPSRKAPDAARTPPAVVATTAGAVPAATAHPAAVDVPVSDASTAEGVEPAGQTPFSEQSANPPGTFSEGSTPGPRTVGPRTSPSGGRSAPAPTAAEHLGHNPPVTTDATTTDAPTARELIAEHVGACRTRPPKDVLGHTAKLVARLLDEGIAPDAVRAGLEGLRAKALHPSTLPSLVNEALNPPAPMAGRPGVTGYRPWTNPAPADTGLVGAGAGSWGSL
ncbi:hypothetical protein [Streptomyces sp. SID3343]|uniref:hypothetical protein n=1 Tax=Streptomyces sp. SID3343 TaxID=2690260 RepID=UPI00136E3676|nr:hypothetical protein [Streptomyces sp. SID3343]MYW03340.1 hypothetical protein [Streptomyces sp. SID3343]MYW06254.1 hypothetical protein [Streptomyces sp. SID3343]